MSEKNKATARRFWEEVFNNRNLELVDELFTDDYVYHGAAKQEIRGKDGLKGYLGMFFNAFPDVHVEVEDVLGEGDKTATRLVGEGTHEGELMGVAPSGKKIETMIICINRFEGDRIAENWELSDRLAVMRQTGATPGPR